MDITSIIGIVGGLVLVVIGIKLDHGNPMGFINVPASVMVIGGSMVTVILAYPMDQIKQIGGTFKVLISDDKRNPVETISLLVEMCTMVRRDGLLALETMVRKVDDPFLAKGVQFVVDGTDPDVTREILHTDLKSKRERHHVGRGIFEFCGAVAPGFALVGTLIGLVAMLANLDPATLGEKMSLALLCTLYGSFVANGFFLPAAKKLERKSEQELLVNEIMIEGLLGIQAGENPRHLEDRLKAFLPVKMRDQVTGGSGGAAALGEAA